MTPFQQVSEFKTEDDIILWTSDTTSEKSAKKLTGLMSQQEIKSSMSSKFSKMLKIRRNSKDKKKVPLPDPSSAMKCPKQTRTGLSCKIAVKRNNLGNHHAWHGCEVFLFAVIGHVVELLLLLLFLSSSLQD